MGTTTQSAPIASQRWPLLGHVPSLLQKRLQFLQEQRANGDIVKLYLGVRPAYLINSPELIRQVLVTDADKFDRGRLFEKGRNFIGDNIATLDGEAHLRQRRLIGPAFHRNRINSYIEIIREQAIARVSGWQPDQPLAIDDEMAQLGLDTLTKSLFSDMISKEAALELQRAQLFLMKRLLVRVLQPDFWEKLPTPGNRRFNAVRSRLWKTIEGIVNSYRREGEETDHGDLMSALVSARYDDTNEPMTAEQVRAEVIAILMAGTESTTVTLSWLFYELSQHPEIERRVHDEIDTVANGKPITYNDIAALEYTNRVINETLRRHTPLWFVLRRSVAATELGGIQIPAGASVLYSLAALHRDPTLYSDPLRFDPDRWLAQPIKELPKGAFIPFSTGAQKCIGDHFAMTEMIVMVATIAARWRLVPATNIPVREKIFATIHPSKLIMTPVPRSTSLAS